MKITIEVAVPAPLEQVWRAWTTPADIMKWNAAADAWHCPAAEIDLRVGGGFRYRMAARDGSMGFDFCGTFQAVVRGQRIAFALEDERLVTVEFVQQQHAVLVRETFEAESLLAAQAQRQGWQAILDNFSRHVQATHGSGPMRRPTAT